MISFMVTLIWHENRFEQKKQKMSIANNKGHNPCSDLARLSLHEILKPKILIYEVTLYPTAI